MTVRVDVSAKDVAEKHAHLLWLMGNVTYASLRVRPDEFGVFVGAAKAIDGTGTVRVYVHAYRDAKGRTGVSCQVSMSGMTFLWIQSSEVAELPPPPEEGVRDYDLAIVAT